MKTLFQQEAVDEIIGRINKLSPNSQRQWGKMNIDQMFAHCSINLETAMGLKFFPQTFFGKLIGRFAKPYGVGEKPIKKNSPTNPAFVFKSTKEFENEKQSLLELINQFHNGGEAKCTSNPHSFLGKLTPTEWGLLEYKHLDHHLKQFGV